MTFFDATREEYELCVKLYADRSRDKKIHMKSRHMIVHFDKDGRRIASASYARGLVPIYQVLDELWNRSE